VGLCVVLSYLESERQREGERVRKRERERELYSINLHHCDLNLTLDHTTRASGSIRRGVMHSALIPSVLVSSTFKPLSSMKVYKK
jgi:hypothetical protein